MEDKQKLDFPIYEFRPDKLTSNKLLRYNNGNWVEDDGEYDLAFIDFTTLNVYYVNLPYRKNLQWSWVKDGKWAAYVRKHPNGNAWHYMTKNGEKHIEDTWERDKHPNIIAGNLAMNKLSSIKGCANGNGVEFNILDETINVGLLRILNTKKIVKIPENFNCIYCGIINLKTIKS